MIEPATPEEILAVNRSLLGVERVISRIPKAWPKGVVCIDCGVTNPIPFGRVGSRPLCYRCKVQRIAEQHSLIGEHQPPRVPTDPNDHKVLDETQRIMRLVIVPGVRPEVAANVSAWVALQLAGLGTLRAVA